ncbi:prephenate dehydratase [Modestobacter sp. Leaf380]|uniref:prephenate dehydratase n=1 Tax=Modestobacter sp. Leaf380 TaxID=1736356 RepID=UPI0006F9A41A|nr:prephenate dehydratase [Modestobacter sp. Leaf380]KQS71158.1 prephenate dehydratase [Modestobacter sp. Leaf380]
MPSKPPTRFAYLGPEGTFTEAALRSTGASSEGESVPLASVPAALAALRSGEVDAAFVPMENSVEGSVSPTIDGLAAGDPVVVTREVFLEVDFVLGVRPGTGLGQVRTVASHPHALAQTRGWVAEHLPGAAVVAAASTAEAARLVALGEGDAAVCPALAAARYGLEVAAQRLADAPGAVTRFVQVERPGRLPAPTGADKTTLNCVVADRTGALLDLLSELASRGISLTRLESRPRRERLGVYSFSLDVEGHLADRRVGDALVALHRLCDEVRFLGSYPRADGREVKPVLAAAADGSFAAAEQWLADVRASAG